MKSDQRYLVVALIGGVFAAATFAQTRVPRNSPRELEPVQPAPTPQPPPGEPTAQPRRTVRDLDRGLVRDRDRDDQGEIQRDARGRRIVRPGDDDSPVRIRRGGRVDRVGGADRRVDRSRVVRSLPSGAERLQHRGREYYRDRDTFFRTVRVGDRVEYRYARPPFGIRVRSLPDYGAPVVIGGVRYFVADDVYYLPTLVDGRYWYEVVAPPIGASIVELPEFVEWSVVGGDRFAIWDDYYFRPTYLNGRLVYVRVAHGVPAASTVFGTLSYRGRLALPSDATAVVRLIDPQRDELIVEEVLPNCGQAPIPFRLDYAARRFDLGRTYVLEATISANGRLMYATADRIPVALRGTAQQVNLVLERARGPVVVQPTPVRAVVRGTLAYRERIALPPKARAVVRLVDLNSPSGQVEVVSESILALRGAQPPIPFEIPYDPNDIDPLGIYAVDAEIEVNGNALFYNERTYRVITRSAPDEVAIELRATR